MNPPWKGPNKATFSLGRIIFSGDNGFVIACASLLSPHDDPEVKVSGIVPLAEEGRTYSADAEWEYKQQYFEWQLKISCTICIEPTSAASIERFLGKLEGIGPKSKKLLVEKYGTDAIKIIGEQGVDAFKAAGVGQALAMRAHLDFIKKQQAWSLGAALLSAAEIPDNLHEDIINRHGKSLDTDIRNNPLCILTFSGISFTMADRLWSLCGVPKEDLRRIIAGIHETIKRDAQKGGHCWIPKDEAVKKAALLLGLMIIPDHLPSAENMYLENCGRLCDVDLYNAEIEIGERLTVFMGRPSKIALPNLDDIITDIIQESDMKPSEEQERALRGIPRSRVSILTGSAGTGKTSTVKWLIKIYQSLGINAISVCAPTAAAARRAKTVLGGSIPASTVHKLIWSRSEPINSDVIIVDEASMLDVKLTADLLGVIRDSAYIVFVGDPYQLPSVAPGAVLRDLIASKRVPQFDLGRAVYRQGKDSGILQLAHAILDGKEIKLTVGGCSCFPDVTHFMGTDPGVLAKCSLGIWDEYQKDYNRVKFITQQWGNKKKDDTSETPMHSKLGVHRINKEIIGVTKFAGCEYTSGGHVFREGMYCIWRENVYEKDLWMVNGQPFVIESLNPMRKTMVISTYDPELVTYVVDLTEYNCPDSFLPGYCSTIHSAQGNEYPAVAYIVQPSDYLSRECVYTAITRAKERLIIVGNMRGLWSAQFETAKRRTGLVQRIQESVGL
jgi:exodeoxyribonuclease V alpha subunit